MILCFADASSGGADLKQTRSGAGIADVGDVGEDGGGEGEGEGDGEEETANGVAGDGEHPGTDAMVS